MQTRDVLPSPDLPPWVLGLTFVEAPQGGVRHLMPAPWISVGFRFAGEADLRTRHRWQRLPWHTVAGLQTRARQMRTAPGGLLLVARLHPATAPAFSPEPAGLVDATVALRCRGPAAVEAADDGARLQLVEGLLRERLAACAPPDPLAVEAIDRIRAERGQVRVDALAKALGVSADTLGRRVKAATGVPPKQFAAIARLHAAFVAPADDLTGRALEAGYFDQPHFNAHVRRTTGLAPSALLAPDAAC